MAVIIIIVVLLAIFVLFAHNSLTKEKNRLELAEVELKKYEESGLLPECHQSVQSVFGRLEKRC